MSMGLFSNPAAGQATNTYNQAYNTATMLGGEGQGIASNLTPFLTQEMLHPQGIGQQGLSAETAAATGGAGGALSAFQGMGAQRAAASHNAGSFQAAMDDASRNATKAKAGASEGIAAGNENLKQQQSQAGAAGLGGMYRTDTSGMLDAMGQQAGDIKTELAADAAPAPWMSQASNAMGLVGQAAKTAAGFGIPGFSGFGGGS
jgi:hypothetical protein